MSDNPVSYSLLTNATTNSFVVSSYLASHHSDYPFNQVPMELYHSQGVRFINKLLSESLVMMTHLEDNADMQFSFVIYQYQQDNLVLHYAYTKRDFRRQGLIKDTLNLILPNINNQIVLTHYPKSPKAFAAFQQYFPHLVFDPFHFQRNYFQ